MNTYYVLWVKGEDCYPPFKNIQIAGPYKAETEEHVWEQADDEIPDEFYTLIGVARSQR